jgi:hypothetical protein
MMVTADLKDALIQNRKTKITSQDPHQREVKHSSVWGGTLYLLARRIIFLYWRASL